MSGLANQHGISRTFLYQLMNPAILYLSLCFSEPSCVETNWHALILLWRLEVTMLNFQYYRNAALPGPLTRLSWHTQ